MYFWMLLVGCILVFSILRQLRMDRLERAYTPIYVPPNSHPSGTLKRITTELQAVRVDSRARAQGNGARETRDSVVLTIESDTQKSDERSQRDRQQRDLQNVLRRYAARPPGKR
jgi:hypothetical protein